MIYQLEVLLRRVRRWFNRSEWAIRLLRLSPSRETTSEPGLVMIQIDGLGRNQLQRALAAGRMPFLKRLLEHEHYELHDFYPGVPTSTPAVQGELFYGIKAAVPAFSYRDSSQGRIVRMYEPTAAAELEQRLAEGTEPLLKDGACYSNIFTGGAAEAHFCPAALGWGAALRAANPLAVGLVLITNFYSFLRTALLLVVEFALALVDFVRGIIDGQDLIKELKFVPTRVAICILLRELITIGAKIDVSRGLPIVHLNLVGYDEQAHRRGPGARFAHWALKGIDDAIARIWREAKRSSRRYYRIWVYSDHGQEQVQSYAVVHRRSVADAVAEVFRELAAAPAQARPADYGVQSQRAQLLGARRGRRLIPARPAAPPPLDPNEVQVAAMGPIGLVYTPRPLEETETPVLGRALVERARVPMVLAPAARGPVRAWTSEGEFSLPEDAAIVLGADHPFLQEVTGDLMDLCRHPDVGQFILCGWRAGCPPMSFPIESGAHGGFGPEETRGFALMPADSPLPLREAAHLRPLDLHRAALHLLDRARVPSAAANRRRQRPGSRLRVMTYNVHSCRGMDGKLSPQRIARVIAQSAPDVVALQELDVGRVRSGSVDQAHLIAQHLEMDFHFHPALHVEGERYGDAILTHLPMRVIKAAALPRPAGAEHLEPRGALWVAVDVDGRSVNILNTHLGLRPRERRLQVEALLSEEWLGHPDCRAPVILCGDFNALPGSRVIRALRARLQDTQNAVDHRAPRSTWFGRYPTLRIDYIFADPETRVLAVDVPATRRCRVASDHLPLLADLLLPPAAARAPRHAGEPETTAQATGTV